MCNFVVNETTQLELRLVNVENENEMQGRIEIKYYGTWGTICADHFNIFSANVACRRLGYVAASRLLDTLGISGGQIWMDDVLCIGNESSLEMCPHVGFGKTAGGCTHFNDIGVECIGKYLRTFCLVIVINTVYVLYVCTILCNEKTV